MKSRFNEAIRRAKDEAIRIEVRTEKAIEILNSIVWKNKPSNEDIQLIKKVIKILEVQNV